MARSGKQSSKRGSSTNKRRLPLVGGFLLFLAILLLIWFGNRAHNHSALPPQAGGGFQTNPAAFREDERQVFAQYAGSASCRDCHEEAFDLWQHSHHGRAERTVDPVEDRAAFDPTRSFNHGTQSTTVCWTNGTAGIIAVGMSGKPELHTAARVLGENPLRQYLVPFPGGRWQVTEAAFDPRSNQWFNVYRAEDRRPGEWGHWTGRGMNWNSMCAACHNTRLRRNYDETMDVYHTAMAEMSVGCEACHGPLKVHNEWQKQFGKSGRKDPTVTKSTHAQVLDTCGFCHARRTDLTGDFKPGEAFLDHFNLVLVDRSERFYADGQIRDEDYEYGPFLSSRMHGRGVYCLDCHNPHSAKTLLPGNWLCLRCHNGSNTNAPLINPVTHSRHKVFGFDTNGMPVNLDLMAYRTNEIQETGGECVNCHMPQTAYMQRHWRHDHGFTSPDPFLTKQLGIPNACNRCHRDKDADWALKYCDEWYGSKMDRPARRRALVIGHAQQGDPQTRPELLEWLKREDSPYWEAATLGLLAPWAAQPQVNAALLRALEHTNALVRAAAAESLETAVPVTGEATANALERALKDPVRAVRVAAASTLRATLDPLSRAGRDFFQFLDSNADQPSGQLHQGMYYFSRNDLQNALNHLEKATAWDTNSAPLKEELAVALSALNRTPEAVEILKEACRVAPSDAEAHYKLGLALDETGDTKGAADNLAIAVGLDPRHALAWYNLGLAQNALGEPRKALESLLRAEAVDPDDARIPFARATILARLERFREAEAAARRALEIEPRYEAARQLLETLSKQ